MFSCSCARAHCRPPRQSADLYELLESAAGEDAVQFRAQSPLGQQGEDDRLGDGLVTAVMHLHTQQVTSETLE